MSLIQRLRCSAYIELVVHRKRCGNLESIRPRYRNARSIRTTVYTCSEPANGRRAVSTSDLDRANFIGFRNGNCLLPRMLTEYRINPPLPLPVRRRTIKSNSFRPLRDNSPVLFLFFLLFLLRGRSVDSEFTILPIRQWFPFLA